MKPCAHDLDPGTSVTFQVLASSAKQGGTSSRWFGYYAGYSQDFVADALRFLELPSGSLIVDPWNGSGTTTTVAERAGFAALGYDINPAIVLVARARLLHSDVRPSHLSLCEAIVEHARSTRRAEDVSEPLEMWFSPSSAFALRAIEMAIQELLVHSNVYQRLAAAQSLNGVSPLAAFFYVALFRTVRKFLARFRTSNPTWVKGPEAVRNRVRPLEADIENEFRAQVAGMFGEAAHRADASQVASVDIGDSKRLPLSSESVDGVITSPPYCTRSDYAVATRPELATIGMTTEEFSQLRSSMIGATTSLQESCRVKPKPEWGRTCGDLLEKIRRHRSHGSSGYYYRTHVSYFDGLSQSLLEISRVLRCGGRAIAVVQDSYYKQVHNDLQRIVCEMSEASSMRLVERFDHQLKRTKAAVNTRHRKYRKSSAAVESILVLEKQSTGE